MYVFSVCGRRMTGGVECFLCGLCARLAHDRETVGRAASLECLFLAAPGVPLLSREAGY